MNKLYLSKTKYCTGMQCPKILWFDRLTEDDFRRLGIPLCKDERDDTYAMTIYATLHEQPPETIERVRTALLAYCKLDTLAMVKVLEKLMRRRGEGFIGKEYGKWFYTDR